MRRPLLALFAVATFALFATACARAGASSLATAPPPKHVTITIHYSHFNPELITARSGQIVQVTLRNEDPIDHEWIVGTAEVHARHRTGTEPYHASVPTEVTIPASSTRVTTVYFDKPGDLQYICHLPGHEEYGMIGTLRIEG